MIFSLVAVILLITKSLAHVEMIYPPPLKSKYDPQVAEPDLDYSMSSPLEPDGSNYPCKGYNSLVGNYNSVATLKAGSSVPVKLGGATHEGGSCQFTISYDGGKTFAVIASIIGSCPLGLSYNVPIPNNLPSAKKALFTWNWFNKTGNREMYQNCAIVDIDGSSSTSFTGPKPFLANVFNGKCITIEGEEPVFSNPGVSVQFASGYSTSSKASVYSGCKNDGTSITIGPNGTTTKETDEKSTSSTTETGSPTTTSIETSVTVTNDSTLTSAQQSKTKQLSNPSSSKPGSHRTSRFRINNHKSLTGSVYSADKVLLAQGSTSKEPVQTVLSESANNNSSSSDQAYLICTSTTTFSFCSGSKCTPMGSVSPGTACVNNNIVLASK